MFFVKYCTELIQRQRDNLQHNSQAGVFKVTSGRSITVTPSIYWSIHCVSACNSESGSILLKQFHVNDSRTGAFLYIVLCLNIWSHSWIWVSAIMLLLSVFCGAYGSISHELALPGRFLPAEHALKGLLRGIVNRGLNQSLWSSSGSTVLISTDSALIVWLLKLTSSSHLITETLLHPSICTIQLFHLGSIILTGVGCFTSICKPSQCGLFWHWVVWWHIFF